MPQELATEYDIDLEAPERVEATITDEYPPTDVRGVDEEEAFVDGGSVDSLAWVALDGYDDHDFFHYDQSPDPAMLRW